MSDDAVPDVDPGSTAGLLAERLQAWKHAVAYLEDYMDAVQKIHKAQSKEYEHALKVRTRGIRILGELCTDAPERGRRFRIP